MALCIRANVAFSDLLLKKRARTISHFARWVHFHGEGTIPPALSVKNPQIAAIFATKQDHKKNNAGKTNSLPNLMFLFN